MTEQKKAYTCIKCGSADFTQGEARTTGGFLSKLVDVQTNKFVTIECNNCGYTEFYKRKSSMGGNIVDFLFGG